MTDQLINFAAMLSILAVGVGIPIFVAWKDGAFKRRP